MAINPWLLAGSLAGGLAAKIFPDTDVRNIMRQEQAIARGGEQTIGRMAAPEVGAINEAANQAMLGEQARLASTGLGGTATGAAQTQGIFAQRGKLLGGAYDRARRASLEARERARRAAASLGMATSPQQALGELSGTALAGSLRGLYNSQGGNEGGADLTQAMNREFEPFPEDDLQSRMKQTWKDVYKLR